MGSKRKNSAGAALCLPAALLDLAGEGEGDAHPARPCVLSGIANPDNVAILDDNNQLLIAEDTVGGHRNDVMWAYNLVNGSMTRVLSSAYGAEITSIEPAADTNINGWCAAAGQLPSRFAGCFIRFRLKFWR